MFPSILTFDFDLILGSFLTFGGLNIEGLISDCDSGQYPVDKKQKQNYVLAKEAKEEGCLYYLSPLKYKGGHS